MNRSLIFACVFSLLLFPALLIPPETRAQGPGRVGLVVQFGNGTVFTQCVSINKEPFSGYDVLLNSGQAIISHVDPIGVAICSIGNEGCPENNCLLCDPQYRYWSYWHLGDTKWVYSQLGAASYTVRNGDVGGWRWGLGQPPEQTISFNQICMDAPMSTGTPTLTPSPSPTPSFTPLPYFTPTPTLIAANLSSQNTPGRTPASTPLATMARGSASLQGESQTNQIWLPAVLAQGESPVLSVQAAFTLTATFADPQAPKTHESPAKTAPEQNTPTPETVAPSAVSSPRDEPLNKPAYLIFTGMVIALGLILTFVMLPRRS